MTYRANITDLPRRGPLAAVLCVCLAAALPARAAPEYINEDVRITGQTVYSSQVDGKPVFVVLGSFKMTAGPSRSISAGEAVIWIETRMFGDAKRHDIAVYAEGNVLVSEPAGVQTTDKKMLATLHVQGAVRVSARVADKPLKRFGVYERALVERTIATRGGWRIEHPSTVPPTRLIPKPTPKPTLKLVPRPPRKRPPRPAPRRPVDRAPLTPGITPLPPPSDEPSPPRQPKPYRKVHFHADGKIAATITADGRRRITTAQRNVVLTMIDPNGRAMEMRCDSMVIISEKRPPKHTILPWAPKVAGVESQLDGPAKWKETVIGVYLEGDVVISRGDRRLRAPAAYYDFWTDRALVLRPVFRSVVDSRNVPLIIRADRMRVLSANELWFKNSQLTTSDFASPTYAIGSRQLYLKEKTLYDETGYRVSERRWLGWMRDMTFRARSWPIFWTPYAKMDVSEGNTALRRLQIGNFGDFGFGAESTWDLFRLLGLVAPEGFEATFDFNWYKRGLITGIDYEYLRDTYSGYGLLYGLYDERHRDDFGDQRRGLEAPEYRGRVLVRHKQFVQDWELQFELGYSCDPNFVEAFFRDEFDAGKQEETLIYAKKQQDNWAVTGLLQYRLNRYQTQTESWPDLAFYLIGEPLVNNRVLLYHESHAGLKRLRPGNAMVGMQRSNIMPRVDTRNEINVPFSVGPVHVVPYTVGRVSYWGDTPAGSNSDWRFWGQAGVKAAMHLWRVYNNASSEMWDLHGLKHVITPVAAGWVTGTSGVEPSSLFFLEPDIEQHVTGMGGFAFGVHQRLQTKRGAPGSRATVDWMRLDVMFGFFNNVEETMTSDGRFFSYRPEHSIPRNHMNVDYSWQISNDTLFQAGFNYDIDRGIFGRSYVGLAVQRDPRFRYYAGVRTIHDADSVVGTFGVNYRISKKYSVSLFEQYDFDFDGKQNLATSFSLIRKFPRWYAAFTLQYDQTNNDLSIFLTLWPEGIPEVRFSARRSGLLGASDMN